MIVLDQNLITEQKHFHDINHSLHYFISSDYMFHMSGESLSDIQFHVNFDEKWLRTAGQIRVSNL